MIIGIGYDIVQIDRIKHAIDCFGRRFLLRCFSEQECQVCLSRPHPVASFAKKFAAKEAFVKALGTGFCSGLSWHDMEVHHHKTGQPFLTICGSALKLLQQKLPHNTQPVIHISLSDDYPQAGAVVLIDAITQSDNDQKGRHA